MKQIKGIATSWLSLTELTNLNSGEGGSNLVDVKKFRYMKETYPYVSGQAMRAYLKESIRRSLNGNEFMCLPDSKGETCGQVATCIHCDLFGYMKTKKKKSKRGAIETDEDSDEEETAGGAETRVSPVKVAPAIGQLPFFENSTLDFLTRRKPQEKTEERKGDIVNVELGKNFYKCGLDIDIQRVGAIEKIDADKRELKFECVVDETEMLSRIRKVFEGIKYLSDYSKQSRLLTDFTPDVICIAFQKRYSHRIQKLFDVQPLGGLNIQRLHDTLSDLLEYSNEVFFGLVSGILPLESERQVSETVSKLGIVVQRPNQAIQAALELIKP